MNLQSLRPTLPSAYVGISDIITISSVTWNPSQHCLQAVSRELSEVLPSSGCGLPLSGLGWLELSLAEQSWRDSAFTLLFLCHVIMPCPVLLVQVFIQVGCLSSTTICACPSGLWLNPASALFSAAVCPISCLWK